MELLDKLKTHWFLITTFATISMAWGADHVKLASLEDAVKTQTEMNRDITKLKEDSARVDERTKMMLQMMEEQNRLSKQLLRNQENTDRKVDKIQK